MSDNDGDSGTAQTSAGISIVAFFTALASSLVIFGVQMGFFLLLRNKLARIFKPKTFMVPERERTEPPPASPWGLVMALYRIRDREIIKKCGLDAYFFLRYLQTLLIIFVPIACIVIPILVPINYVGGIGQSFGSNNTNSSDPSIPAGLDTIAWGNIKPVNANRRWAHLIIAVLVVAWVCFIAYNELRIYIKIRQDYLTSAEHRLRASANTVLVSGIPTKWLTDHALRGLFDVFPGGIRNIWLTRDYTKLLDKINKRDDIHQRLESAESELIRKAKKNQLKKRKKEERAERKAKHETKAERAQREHDEDIRAKRMAEGEGGVSSGDQDVPQVDGGGDDSKRNSSDNDDADNLQREQSNGFKVPIIGSGLAKVGQGLKGGFGKAGRDIVGGAKNFQQGVDNQLERTGGFEFVGESTKETDVPGGPSSLPGTRTEGEANRDQSSRYGSRAVHRTRPSDASAEPDTPGQAQDPRPSDVSLIHNRTMDSRTYGNTTRKVTDWDNAVATENSKWWQFWKPPSGAYASPIPQGSEGDEFPFDTDGKGNGTTGEKKSKSKWAKIKAQMPFFGGDEIPAEYPAPENPAYLGDDAEDANAEWTKWLKKSDRPTHRLPLFEWTPGWLPGLPLIHKKVDSIYFYRKELARLNMEIEKDQHEHERYPKMNSAFIQFNNQVAAHMACQSVTHHVPKHMSPRVVEVSPSDVIWDNMAIRWWDEWLRTFIVIGIVFGMTILWAFPVAFTSSLSQIDSLVKRYSWLSFIDNNAVTYNVAKAVAGVLPALLLSLLLAFVPILLEFLAKFQGAKTGSQKAEYVQMYYFFFLFVQVFLVVSIASGAIATLQDTVTNIQGIPETLAKNLPKAANYFFSYMILQAMSTSSGTLLQIGVLLVWYVLARILDDTARSKWRRQTDLPTISWGSFFPVYTNFACIALVYAVIAPLIAIFAIITFALLWVAYRYNMIYVTRFKIDTGGVLYPRAINQTFTGLYFMELCLIGLFFLVRNENGDVACAPQAIVMIVVLALTVGFQVLLNVSFGPLLRYLPITFEDEAVLRDEMFQRAQDRRLGLTAGGEYGEDDEEGNSDELSTLTGADSKTAAAALSEGNSNDVELKKIGQKGPQNSFGLTNKLNPVRGIVTAGTWAARGGKKVRYATLGKAEDSMRTSAAYRQQRRQKDLEAQRAMGEALYGGYNDEIEDLTPEERDVLVKEAFKHSALRAHRPTVWIPRDDIGVSDDEIRHTCNLSDYIWISNAGTALDSKVRVVYGRAPPDFSDLELINL
ncbi:hypothetical protein HMPREF1624_05893 [Sporothrix schenckii ATCC 58251]|uniref:CSC1/OSCA1-like 7TM region domain-containing protein n=1 Tax=Sporothrix schenckii (strain ATCC 58251 / de Perez 2211183) TaxID=1391915 RepID=U7PQ53_SPOS1|nr:hypothetical protein HMPREF1624_05893 [Sporothrix schenckii ATCC 58251]